MIFLNEFMIDNIIVESWTYDDFIYNMSILDNTINLHIQECCSYEVLTEGFVDKIKEIFEIIKEKVQKFIGWIFEKLRDLKKKISKMKDKILGNTGNVDTYTITDDTFTNLDIVEQQTQDLTYAILQYNILLAGLSGGSIEYDDAISKLQSITNTVVNKVIDNKLDIPHRQDIVIKEKKEMTLEELEKYANELLDDMSKISDKLTNIREGTKSFYKTVSSIHKFKFSADQKELQRSMYQFALQISEGSKYILEYSGSVAGILGGIRDEILD